MKIVLAGLMCLLCASTASAQPRHVVRWQDIVGVITAQNVNNPITDPATGDPIINSGTFAWTTKSGQAQVNLDTGATSFQVHGLSINGTGFSGTPGPNHRGDGHSGVQRRRSDPGDPPYERGGPRGAG
jgi:hypothetical protein